MNTQGYLSQTLDIEQLKKDLEERKRMFFDVPAGYGKTTFVLKDLRNAIEGKILYLVSRDLLHSQLELKLKEYETKGIEIKTYQLFQSDLFKEERLPLQHYELIVCDECHYFIQDAPFSNYTDLLLDRIIAEGKHVLFMTATPNDFNVDEIANIDTIRMILHDDYVMPKFDYSIGRMGDNSNLYEAARRQPRNYSEIEKIVFYDDNSHIKSEMQNILERGEKALIFVEDKDEGAELYKAFENYSLFVCSKYAKSKYTKLINEEKRDEMTKNEKFDCNFLITTKALDVGVNLCDRDIKHIFIDSWDLTSVLQCIGRKRIQDDADRFTLHYKTHFHKLKRRREYLAENLKYADDYINLLHEYRRKQNDELKQLQDANEETKKKIKAAARDKAYYVFCMRYHRFSDPLHIVNFKYKDIDFNYCLYLKYCAEYKTIERMLTPLRCYKAKYQYILVDSLNKLRNGEQFVLLQELNLIKYRELNTFHYENGITAPQELSFQEYFDGINTQTRLRDIPIIQDTKEAPLIRYLQETEETDALADKKTVTNLIQAIAGSERKAPKQHDKINIFLAINNINYELYKVDGRKFGGKQAAYKVRKTETTEETE